MSIVTADIWSGIEAVITSTTGNRVAVLSGPRVRIPPTPPEVHRNFDRITVDFFYARKPLEIRLLDCFSVLRTPLQSISAAGFCAFYGD